MTNEEINAKIVEIVERRLNYQAISLRPMQDAEDLIFIIQKFEVSLAPRGLFHKNQWVARKGIVTKTMDSIEKAVCMCLIEWDENAGN